MGKLLYSSLIAVVLIATIYGQSSRPINNIPIRNAGSACGQLNQDGSQRRINYVADATNACWYWECDFRRGRSILRPRNCPLGTAVSSFFGLGSSNPCTRRFNVNAQKYDCTRKKFDLGQEARPQCFRDYLAQGTCKNGGQVKFEYDICECDCRGTGFTDWDCSKRQQDLVPPPDVDPGQDPCPGGVSRVDRCVGNPCQNNGRCINQCTDYVCQCVPPFTAGRSCELFDCTENVECLNGGTCSRGPSGINQVATCACLPGFTGMMCELIAGK